MRQNRISRTKDGNLIMPAWLAFDRAGNMRLTRNEPSLCRNERSMQLTITVPISLFSTPTISASLTVDAPALEVPQIDVCVAAEALKGALGCDVDVRIVAPLP